MFNFVYGSILMKRLYVNNVFMGSYKHNYSAYILNCFRVYSFLVLQQRIVQKNYYSILSHKNKDFLIRKHEKRRKMYARERAFIN